MSNSEHFPIHLRLWQRGSKTFGLAMLLVRACGADTFVPWTLLERAGASCLFMLELNFHSGSSISQVRLTSRSDCYRIERGSVPALTRDDDLLGRGFDSVLTRLIDCSGVYQFRLSCSEIVRMWIYVMLLPPPKLQAIAPRVFVIGDYVGFSQMFERWMMSQFDRLLSVDHFRHVSARTADIGTLGAIYIDCGVPVMLGGPIGSETRQRWSCVLRYHSWDGLVITISCTVGLPEGKIFGSVDHIRDVSVWTADIETLGAIYIDCGVPVMLGGPIGSETR
ncbi:hypothetical protein F2Q69_00024222 [Brassica cretica]|uniref:Uncharacterized protein n=1 Tax=Brassica cretica TaxID=69181 RepID=A0A8S9Q0Y4_BRACR|nr:hypothetical protein F2Q69_00024222 [Brassica cretica]